MEKKKRKIILISILLIIAVSILYYLFLGLPWERTKAEKTALDIIRGRYYADCIISNDHFDFKTRTYTVYTSTANFPNKKMILKFEFELDNDAIKKITEIKSP